uniref:Ig-like domain-containing protein n=1 Tax=Sinocyclocheilus anshuiensis TaxID=1608454 RepID=A0A671MVR5_9TELE
MCVLQSSNCIHIVKTAHYFHCELLSLYRKSKRETVTLRCDIDGEGVTSWQYSWYKDGSVSFFSELQEHTFRFVTESDAGKYSCYGAERGGSRTSNISDAVTLTVSGETKMSLNFPKPKLTARSQSSLFTGDSVTLRCEVDQSQGGWEFLWSKNSNTESTEAATKTINSVKVSDGGEYMCRAQRGGYFTDYSEPVTVTIYERPKPTVTIKPDRHAFGDTVTLRCDIYGEGFTSWRYNWYKDGLVSVFSELQEHTFSPVTESDAGKYSCYGTERGGSRYSHRSDAVTLRVSGEFDHLLIEVTSLHKFKRIFQVQYKLISTNSISDMLITTKKKQGQTGANEPKHLALHKFNTQPYSKVARTLN